MWRIDFRSGQRVLCQSGRCPVCDFARRPPVRHVALPSLWEVQQLKADFAAMIELRDILRQAGGMSSVVRVGDDAVIRGVVELLSSGRIRLCGHAGDAPLDDDPVAGRRLRAARRAAEALANVVGTMRARGREIRVIPPSEWNAFHAADGFAVIPGDEARTLLGELVARAPRSKKADEAFADVLGMLSADPRQPLAGALVVIGLRSSLPGRTMPPESAAAPGSAPRAPELSTHWVEIEVVGEDGIGVPGQDYLIVAPDKKEYTGQTDGQGLARVDDIPAGPCWVSFPGIDKSAWHRA